MIVMLYHTCCIFPGESGDLYVSIANKSSREYQQSRESLQHFVSPFLFDIAAEPPHIRIGGTVLLINQIDIPGDWITQRNCAHSIHPEFIHREIQHDAKSLPHLTQLVQEMAVLCHGGDMRFETFSAASFREVMVNLILLVQNQDGLFLQLPRFRTDRS